MEIKSLNEARKDPNALLIIFNCEGEITADVTPTPTEMELFENYWSADYVADEFVLRDKGQPVLGIQFEFDAVWAADILNLGSEKDAMPLMPKMLAAARGVTEKTVLPLAAGCDVYLGDSETHTLDAACELLVVVPFNEREKYKKLVDKLSEVVYDEVETAFKSLAEMGVKLLNTLPKNPQPVSIVFDSNGEVAKGISPTEEEYELQEKFWHEDENRFTTEMVIRDYGTPALGIYAEFSEQWLMDCLGLDDDEIIVRPVMPMLFVSIDRIAHSILKMMFPLCNIYIGESTNMGGHELLVAVPYDQRKKFRWISDRLEDTLWSLVVNDFRLLLGTELYDFYPTNLDLMRELMAKYGEANGDFFTKSEDAEFVKVFIHSDRIVTHTFDFNDRVKRDIYWEDGRTETSFPELWDGMVEDSYVEDGDCPANP